MSEKINFTQKTIEALSLPEPGKRLYFRDTKVDGLEVMVTHSGVKSFKVYRKFQGKPVRITLGKYPDLSVENARNKALEINAGLAKGINPNEEKKKVRNEYTFKELFDRYIDDYAKPNGNKSWEEDVKDVNRNLRHWLNRKISSISKDEIAKLHADFGNKRGSYGANRLLDRINAIFNKAIEWGWDGKNPANGVKKFKMQSRDRFLKADELPVLFEALAEEESAIAKDYILISLLTGARKGNVLAMRWQDVDFHERTWRIPDTKNREPLTIPLVAEAITILLERKKATAKIENSSNGFVFPGTGGKGHLADPKKAWKRLCRHATLKLWERDEGLSQLVVSAKANLPEGYTVEKLFKAIEAMAEKKGILLPLGLMDVRIHDLRRTLGSWQAATGATTAIIGKSLGHKSQRATAVYERLNIDPVRDSVERATAAMWELLKN